MQVFGTGPRPPQNFPFLDRNGIAVYFRGGDICSVDNYENPVHIARRWCPWPVLPFVTFRLGRLHGYIGWKAFGMDEPAQLNWPSVGVAEVHPGSVALTGFTARLSMSREP